MEEAAYVLLFFDGLERLDGLFVRLVDVLEVLLPEAGLAGLVVAWVFVVVFGGGESLIKEFSSRIVSRGKASGAYSFMSLYSSRFQPSSS